MNSNPPAVVVGLDCITGLQTARILAERGVPVTGMAGDRRHYAARTRVCRRVVEADLTSDALVPELERLGAELGRKAVLLPCTDLAVAIVAGHRARLDPLFHIPLPDAETVATLMDKMRFMEYAQDRGLPIPPTVVLRDRADAERAAAELTFPCILKPPMKSPLWQSRTSDKVIPVRDPDELLRTYDRVRGWAELLVVQQWVAGGEDALYSCNAYFDARARPLATFVARKLRQWPPHTGTSSLGEEVRNEVVLAETLRLFSGVGFHGLAYLEMKRDSRTGEHFIIEPNVGRPTGRSAIAECGGVELLLTAYRDAAGLALPPREKREQRYTGAKWIDVRRDTQSALYFLRRGELTPRAWWRSVRGHKAHAVFSLSDPAPFLAELRYAGGAALRPLLRLVRHSTSGLTQGARPRVPGARRGGPPASAGRSAPEGTAERSSSGR